MSILCANQMFIKSEMFDLIGWNVALVGPDGDLVGILRRLVGVWTNYYLFGIFYVLLRPEDPDLEETKEFVQKQVELTQSVLKECDDTRGKLSDKITKLFDHPRYDPPFRRGSKYFYSHNTGLQAQNVLYLQDSLDGAPEVLLDPNMLSEDGTVALSTYSVSEDAKYLAYALSTSGSDWVTIKVMRVEDKKLEPETLSWVKFSGISWTHDNKGFFYSRCPAPK